MLNLPLSTVKTLLNDFMREFNGYTVKTYELDPYKKIFVVEDTLVLYANIFRSDAPVCNNPAELFQLKQGVTKYVDNPCKNGNYYGLCVSELTYDSIGFNHNHSRFLRASSAKTGINFLGVDARYRRFKLPVPNSPEDDLTSEIDALIPEIRLSERLDAWPGICYNFIVMEFTPSDGGAAEWAAAYTTRNNPHSYVVSKCGEWIKRGLNWIGDDNTYEGVRSRNQGACKAFNSWKGKPRQYRLENHFKYFVTHKYFRTKEDAKNHTGTMLETAYSGDYTGELWGTYKRPVNKWVSEEKVYKITKKLYKSNAVIYRHRPFFLKGPTGGQMSYDVFITGLNVAIEYQGKQHFEPVDFLGGAAGYEKTVARDKLKKALSSENGIALIYVYYWEEITDELIREKVEKVLKTRK